MTDHPVEPPPPAPKEARTSPFRINLEQQRKRARDLVIGLRASEAHALSRFRRHHPGPAGLHNPDDLDHRARLSGAQLVIARELGFPSWPKLRVHIQAMERARAHIAAATGNPDGDARTLHIRCGSDIETRLREAGFAGDFLEYSDALCQGPVLEGENWLTHRAGFLTDAYGSYTGQNASQTADKLRRAEEALNSAAQSYERVVIWVEHDSYDQLVLARCLAAFAADRPPRLELISVERFPGNARFIGLGQLPPEALRLLWDERRPVSAQQVAAGRSIWVKLHSDDPTPLARAAQSGVPGLPQMTAAIRRHCQELPWSRDGLSLTERLALQLLAEGPQTVGTIFWTLTREREPLPWLGDFMLSFILDSMKAAREPVFTGVFEGERQRWAEERLSITDLGRAVLAGEVDWLSLSPPDRWLGGVRISASAPCWRWDDQTRMTVLREAPG